MDKISAICIVKNEEKNILTSINSYKNIVDEIIIIDTGSTDNTIGICESNGCIVYKYEWDNNFSNARNFGLEKAKYDYILFLDADEYFSPALKEDDKKYLINLCKNYNYDGVKIHTYNIDVDTFRVINDKYNLKFFKNNKNIRYRRKIHETLHHNNRDMITVGTDELCIMHTGYGINRTKEKSIRNISILKTLDDFDTIDYMYLVRENISIGNYDEADYYYDLFFKAEDHKEVLEKSDIAYLIYFYKLYILRHNHQSTKEQLNIMKKEIPHIPEVYYELGLYYFDVNFDKSYDYLLKAIKKNDDLYNNHEFILNNYSKFESDIYYRLAYIDYINNKDSLAFNRCAVSCMLNNRNVNAFRLLLRLIRKKNTNECINIINKIMKPSTTSDYDFITNELVNTDLRDVFIYFASVYNAKYNGRNNTVFIAIILSGKYEEVINRALEIYDLNKNVYNQFIIATTIMYVDDEKLYKKYKDKIAKDHQMILDHYFYRTDLNKDLYHEYFNLCIRLCYMIPDIDIERYIDIDRVYDSDIYDLIKCEYDICNYKNVIDICEYIFTKDYANRYLTDIIRMYLISCKKSKHSVMKSDMILKSGIELSFRRLGGIK